MRSNTASRKEPTARCPDTRQYRKHKAAQLVPVDVVKIQIPNSATPIGNTG